MSEHRWSGWPGAWCLDCGREDPREISLAYGGDGDVDPALLECPEPGSKRFDPYTHITSTRTEVERLIRERDRALEDKKSCIESNRSHVKEIVRLQQDVARLTRERDDWRECARYDPKMEGPAFKGWDRSALDRCRKKYIETIFEQSTKSADEGLCPTCGTILP